MSKALVIPEGYLRVKDFRKRYNAQHGTNFTLTAFYLMARTRPEFATTHIQGLGLLMPEEAIYIPPRKRGKKTKPNTTTKE